VAYRELSPPPALSAHVACLWVRTDAAERVLPDGCVDVVWTGEQVIVAGPATRAVTPAIPASEVKVGVRFRVGAAHLALGLPAEELLDRSPALGEVWREGDEVAERVADSPDVPGRLAALVDAVGRRLSEAPAPDPLLRAAVRELARPRAQVGPLSGRLSISERQLRRRFGAAVGYSPRTLARVLRLQRFLALAGPGGDLARVAAEAGYADQPHLTRECATLAGIPPGALLAAGAGPAGERL
jgi:AraC-like DNA-binding protein